MASFDLNLRLLDIIITIYQEQNNLINSTKKKYITYTKNINKK
jgi:hypothetical protein